VSEWTDGLTFGGDGKRGDQEVLVDLVADFGREEIEVGGFLLCLVGLSQALGKLVHSGIQFVIWFRITGISVCDMW